MIKILKQVRGAVDNLGLEVYLYEVGKVYPDGVTPTSESLEANLVKGGFAEFVKPQPEQRLTKVDEPEVTKPSRKYKKKAE